jgi:hypothetical protein
MSTQTKTPEPRAPTLAHAIVSREEWVKTRKELLKKEKEFTGNAMNLAGNAARCLGSKSKSLTCLTPRRAKKR